MELVNLLSERLLINPYEEILLAIMVAIIMFGMGATLNLDDFKKVIKKPKGIIVGFLSQFGFMPFIAFIISRILNLDPYNAVALILIGCLPAGSTSNMFAYFSRGDVALSISMTTASTLLAIIMTPLLLVFYASGFADQIQIPVKNIIISLLLVLIPVIGGMILRRKSQRWAKAAEDTAGFTGFIIIVFLVGSVVVRHGDLLLLTPAKIYFASILVGIIGFLFGYLFSGLLKASPRHRRTISLETGIQNGPLSFAIILLSFDKEVANQLLWLPILYSSFIVCTSTFITLFYRKVGKADYELFVNETVQKKLFGDNYRQGMSGPKEAR
jgi:BASS family bile acid:Na+ symporter